jgi:hypothetical protein
MGLSLLVVLLDAAGAAGAAAAVPPGVVVRDEVHLRDGSTCFGGNALECPVNEFCAFTGATGSGLCVPCTTNCTKMGVPELIQACETKCFDKPADNMTEIHRARYEAALRSAPTATHRQRRLAADIKTTTGEL